MTNWKSPKYQSPEDQINDPDGLELWSWVRLNGTDDTSVMRVPGGWLVQVNHVRGAVSICYVPQPSGWCPDL